MLLVDEKKWSAISVSGDEKPLSRSAATMVSVDKKLYLFGGLNQSVGWLDDSFVFNTGICGSDCLFFIYVPKIIWYWAICYLDWITWHGLGDCYC